MNRNQARMLLLITAHRAARARDFDGLRYAAETAVKLTQVEQLGRELRGRLAHVGVTNNHVLSLLHIAGCAGETFDFEALAHVAATVVLREQLSQLRYEVQCRLAHLASKYGMPTREASRPPRKPSNGPTRKADRRRVPPT
jgi:hypothetical protein